jgi:hypothetical protein
MLKIAYEKALEAAFDHAQNNTKCRHFGCSILLNDEFYKVVQNDAFNHAEINALNALKIQERRECLKCN